MGNQLGLNRPAYTRPGITRASVNRVRIEPAADLTPHPLPPKGEGGGWELGSATEVKRTEVEELLAAADRLPPAARKQLLDHLALKTATAQDDPRDVDMWAGAIYEALQRHLGSSGGSLGGPMVVKRAVGAPSAFGFIREFVADAGLADITVQQRQALYRLLARLLVNHAADVARHVNAPLSVKFVANNSNNMAAVFERSFPGYVKSGTAKLMLEALTRRA